MEFNIRTIGTYNDVSVTCGNTKIELGLLGEDECIELARKMKEAIYDLLTEEQYNNLMDME